MGRNYWMVVQSPENFIVSKTLGFTVHGLRAQHRRRADRMTPDDRILYYISGLRKWGAIATVKSRSFQETEPIWDAVPPGETFPYRVKLKPDLVLDEKQYIDGLILGPRLEYVKRWAPEDWPLAFFDTLHLIPQRDFRLVEAEMKRVLSNGKRRRSRRRGQRRGGMAELGDRATRRRDGDQLPAGARDQPAGVLEQSSAEEDRREPSPSGSSEQPPSEDYRREPSPGALEQSSAEEDRREPQPSVSSEQPSAEGYRRDQPPRAIEQSSAEEDRREPSSPAMGDQSSVEGEGGQASTDDSAGSR